MRTTLSDLDELVLRCRDDRARRLISEATASYNAGAFRAAIVSTWVAVCLDLIDKFRELALTGDKNAEKLAEKIELIRSTNNLSAALAFEREILTTAKSFELLSPMELFDLQRLQDDRNRCAHPSLIAEETDYRPPAELARLHIVSAIDHLLQHPPVQGKQALARLEEEIFSEYFPKSSKEALKVLSNGPLNKPRESLVRSIILEIIKRMAMPAHALRRGGLIAALEAISLMHGQVYEDTIRKKLPQILRNYRDNVFSAISLAKVVPRSWPVLEPDLIAKFEIYVDTLSSDDFDIIESTIDIAPLRSRTLARIARASRVDFEQSTFFYHPPEALDRVIELYKKSRNYDEANSWARYVIYCAREFSAKQVIAVIEAAGENPEISNSFGFNDVATELKKNKSLSNEQLDAAFKSANLEMFASDWVDVDDVPF
ncbi:hypothetical protein [Lysobacter sp. Hz 25]|uniref:hypothetical protein n=1 Tax=Lysobacter sp. Hz 25 TaxID=3383698 RepID=UPI0038D42814